MSAGDQMVPPSTDVDLMSIHEDDLGAMIAFIDAQCKSLMDLLPSYRQAVIDDRRDLYPDRVKALNALRVQATYAIKRHLGHVQYTAALPPCD